MQNQEDKNILIVAGEASGDFIGSEIVQSLSSKIHFWGCGGEKLKTKGVEILYSIDELSVVGFVEAIQNFFRMRNIIKKIVELCIKNKTKFAILIDFQGFNYWLGKELKKNQIKTVLVGSPQFWAWRPKRIYKVGRIFQKIFCLYNFEHLTYQQKGLSSVFMGHPLVIQDFKTIIQKDQNKIVLFPGSRNSEIQTHLNFMLELVQPYSKDFQIVIPYATVGNLELMKKIAGRRKILFLQDSIQALNGARLAIAISGTNNLISALMQVPFLVVYKTSFLNYFLFKILSPLKYISLVNILSGKFVIQEFLQNQMKIKACRQEINNLLFNLEYRKLIQENFLEVKKELGNKTQFNFSIGELKKLI